jgi:hypothetical protein
MKKLRIGFYLLLAIAMFLPSLAQASTVLDHVAISINSTAGGAAGVTTSDMVDSAGTVWQGGAVGVQGGGSLNNAGANAVPAIVAWKYDVGSVVDSLNDTYGAGQWSIENAQVSFRYTLYANNSRFGAGAGDFDVYWVGNDSWVYQTSDPVFADNETGLAAWAGEESLLAEAYYSWSTPTYTGTYDDLNTSVWSTDKTGDRQSSMAVDLDLETLFLEDILTASADGDNWVSLYLMAASDTVGICIFTGGAGSGIENLPTLTFDVVDTAAVPIPGAVWLLGSGLLGLVGMRRREK